MSRKKKFLNICLVIIVIVGIIFLVVVAGKLSPGSDKGGGFIGVPTPVFPY